MSVLPPQHADPTEALQHTTTDESHDTNEHVENVVGGDRANDEEDENEENIDDGICVDGNDDDDLRMIFMGSKPKLRETYALQGLFNAYKKKKKVYMDELAMLRLQHLEAAKVLHDIRSDIINGVRDITPEEIAAIDQHRHSHTHPSHNNSNNNNNDAANVMSNREDTEHKTLMRAASDPHGGIPFFWFHALLHTTDVDVTIEAHDHDALRSITNITYEYMDRNPRKGVVLNFFFGVSHNLGLPNPNFRNTSLTKKLFVMGDDVDDHHHHHTIIATEGTQIVWNCPEQTLTQKCKTTPEHDLRSRKWKYVVTSSKRKSFFNFFLPRRDDDDDDDDSEYNVKRDACVGEALMEMVMSAAYNYSGRGVELLAQKLAVPQSVRPARIPTTSRTTNTEETTSTAEQMECAQQ